MTMSMIDKTQKRTERERKNEYPNDDIHAGRRRVQDKDDVNERRQRTLMQALVMGRV